MESQLPNPNPDTGRKMSSHFRIHCQDCYKKHRLVRLYCPHCHAFNWRHPIVVAAFILLIAAISFVTIMFMYTAREHLGPEGQ